MESPEQSGNSLHRALESKGWSWHDDWLYPPHKTFSFRGTKEHDPPREMLMRIHKRMKHNLDKLRHNKPYHLSDEHHQNWISDMESLVNTLEEFLGGNQVQ